MNTITIHNIEIRDLLAASDFKMMLHMVLSFVKFVDKKLFGFLFLN